MEQSEVINSMVNDILMDRSNDAMEKFSSLMAARVSDAIDSQKQKIASTIYKGNTENEDV